MTFKNRVKHFMNRMLSNHEIVSRINLDLRDFVKNPSDIIDVGVYQGTEFLLQTFTESFYHLVEPNQSTYNYIERDILNKYKGKLYKCAAGEKEGSLYLSSNDDESRINSDTGVLVPVKKLDDIIELKDAHNAVLKVDVEGHELQVLKGASRLLEDCIMVILELRLRGPKKVNEPSEIIDFLAKRGFRFVDILSEGRRKEGLNFIDAVFMK